MDQAAYGLSTFLVTAMVSRFSSAPDFARFMVLWTTSWTICALSTELLVTPLRIHLPRGQLSPEVVADLQQGSVVVALATTLLAVAVTALHSKVAGVFGVLAVVTAGLSFLLRRAVLYSRGHVVAAMGWSTANLMATVFLLAAIRISGQETAGWGQAAAALALVLPLATGIWTGAPAWRRIGPAVLRLSRSGAWLATGSGLRNLVCSSGLLTLVVHVHGLQAAAALGHILVLASPVQLASSALPLLLLPTLVQSIALGAKSFRRVLYRQLGLYLLCGAAGLIVLLVMFDWWRRILVHESEATPVGYLPVAFCVLGVLLSSWSGSALQAVRPAAYSFLATLVAAISLPLGLAVNIPTPYLVSLPYACSILTQVVLVVTVRRGSLAYSLDCSSTT